MSKLRVRRHLHDQMLSLMYAIHKMVSSTGKNKDFLKLNDDTQRKFLELLKDIDDTQSHYASYLWDAGVELEKKGQDPRKILPQHMIDKVNAVEEYTATLPKE